MLETLIHSLVEKTSSNILLLSLVGLTVTTSGVAGAKLYTQYASASTPSVLEVEHVSEKISQENELVESSDKNESEQSEAMVAPIITEKKAADFTERQIGNLGKLHDFAAVLDESESTDENHTTTSTFTTLLAETVIAKRSFLNKDDVFSVLNMVEGTFALNLSLVMKAVEEKVASFAKKHSQPLILDL